MHYTKRNNNNLKRKKMTTKHEKTKASFEIIDVWHNEQMNRTEYQVNLNGKILTLGVKINESVMDVLKANHLDLMI